MKKGNGNMNKDTGKWCNFHKNPLHNTNECHTKQSLVAQLRALKLDLESDFDSKMDKGKKMINAEPSATIATTQRQPEDVEDPEKSELLFHLKMWVKGVPLHFIVDNGIQNNLILAKVIKQLKFPTMPHPQPYNIGWISQG